MSLFCGRSEIEKCMERIEKEEIEKTAQNACKRKKRKAVWRECPWCEKRGISPSFRSGKLKTFLKHTTQCEADFRLISTLEERPRYEVLLGMIKALQKQNADFAARIGVLEARKARTAPKSFQWTKIRPKHAWKMRKMACVRYFRALLSQCEPSRIAKTPHDYIEMWILSKQVTLHDILSTALWPVIKQGTGNTIALQNIDTTDIYFIIKALGFASPEQCKHNLQFWKEAIEECGLPLDRFYSHSHIKELEEEFFRGLEKAATIKKTQGGDGSGSVAHGLITFVRVWRQMYVIDEDLRAVCTSLGPEQVLTWET